MTDEYPRLEVQEGRVIMRGDWAEEIIHDVAYSGTENLEAFEEQFTIVEGDHVANQDYYQGMHMMALIERKSDGRRFGYAYWQGGGKYGESDVEPNGDEHGLDVEYEDDWTDADWDREYERRAAYVWLPVEPYPVEYWRIKE